MASGTRYSALERCSGAGDAVVRFSPSLGISENTLRGRRAALQLTGAGHLSWTTLGASPAIPATLQ